MKLVHRDDFLEQLLEYSQEMSVLFEKHDVYFHQFMVYIISYRKGEGMNDVKKTKILIPNSELIGKFSEMSKKMFELLQINDTIGEKLSRTRDALLPRLMSGELKVN